MLKIMQLAMKPATTLRLARAFASRVHKNSAFTRQLSSALFIPGNRAMDTFSYLSPYLDFDRRFGDSEKLRNETYLRGLNLDIDEMKKTWDFYKSIKVDKQELERKKEQYATMCAEMYKIGQLNREQEAQLASLKTRLKGVKDNIKSVQEILWELEENIVVKCLALPNELDSAVPDESSILETRGNISSSTDPKSHVEVGARLNILDYRGPMHYFLSNEAADFELGVLRLAAEIFRQAGAIGVSGLDFARSLVVEGSGLDPTKTSFVLDNYQDSEKNCLNEMHVVGGASLASFLALHAKQEIKGSLPLKYVATGKQYSPLAPENGFSGLFSACQESAVRAFVVTKKEDYDKEFWGLVETTKLLYNDVCEHYRIVSKPAKELEVNESWRVSFEMWSPLGGKYVEVGHVSGYRDFLSKRLLVMQGDDMFLFLISGMVMSVPKVLACMLENDPGTFTVPKKVAKFCFNCCSE